MNSEPIHKRLMRALRKALENWEQEVLRPILTTLLTAIILFTASLLFKPVRSFFFPSEVKEYPLHCTAEPYVDASREFLLVDFFIINHTNNEHTSDELNSFLETHNSNPDAHLSPDITLKYSRMLNGRPLGRFETVVVDDDFNRDKGELAVDKKADQLSISVKRIASWAVMKVTIRVAGLPDLDSAHFSRMAKVKVPFDFQEYQDGCYSR